MSAKVAAAKANASSINENRTFEVDIGKNNVTEEPIINPALLNDILMDSGMIEDFMLNGIREYTKPLWLFFFVVKFL